MKRFIIGLAAIAALGACSKGASTPGAAVESFLRMADSGDCNGISNALTKESRDMMGEKLVAACKMGKEQADKMPDAATKRLKSVNIIEAKEEGERATVTVEVENNAGQKERQTMVLRREDGAWKIDPMASAQAGMGGAPTGATPPTMPAPTMPTTPAPDMTPPADATPPAADTETPAETPAPAPEAPDKE